MPYRAIFSDIDGTLLNREHRISWLIYTSDAADECLHV